MTTIVLSPSTNTSSTEVKTTVYSPSLPSAKKASSAPGKKNIESAVFSHIQALRALGVTRTDASEIARGLKLGQSEVEKTISSLVKKGVKIVNG
jgi:Holliday junction resolvasome RuvABC DNA-binding subunit